LIAFENRYRCSDGSYRWFQWSVTPEDINRLFTEFEQLDSGTARRFEGTGLGLALTKKIVEFQGGHIKVESEPSKGSVFTVVLPVMTRNGEAT
jgi:signal transduction histidine kinase